MAQEHFEQSPLFARAHKYQKRYVGELYGAILSDVDQASAEAPLQFLFSAPTGSGKTFMAQLLLDALFRTPEFPPIVVVWVSIGRGGLEQQSMRSFAATGLFEGKLKSLDDIREPIRLGDLVFASWEELRSTKKGDSTRRYERDSEQTQSLASQIQQLTARDIKVLVLIDESHATSKSGLSQEILAVLSPFIVVEVTATPRFVEPIVRPVHVPITAVRDSGIIKWAIEVNHGLETAKDRREALSASIGFDLSIPEVHLVAALEKHNAVKQDVALLPKKFNPLLLVQIEDGISEAASYRLTKIINHFGHTEQNRRLGVWMTGDRRNVEGVELFDSQVEVLMFKQAISTGWDCPRAYTLCQVRDVKSGTLQLQTLGRILRLPQGFGLFERAKSGDGASLMSGYLYSYMDDPKVESGEEDFFVTRKTVRDGLIYEHLRLRAEYAGLREYDIRVAVSVFELSQYLSDVWKPYVGDLKPGNDLSKTSLANMRADVARLYPQTGHVNIQNVQRERLDLNVSHNEAEIEFFASLYRIAKGFNSGWVENQLTEAIIVSLRMMGTEGDDEIVQKRTFLANQNLFAPGLASVLKGLLPRMLPQASGHVRSEWEAPEASSLSEGAYLKIVQDSQPNVPCLHRITLDAPHGNRQPGSYRAQLSSNPERGFIAWLQANCVTHRARKDIRFLWWYKNGQNGSAHFGIRYVGEDGYLHTFYPDFLVMCRVTLNGVSKSVLFVAEIKEASDVEVTTFIKQEALELWLNNAPTSNDELLVVGDVIRVDVDTGIPLRLDGSDVLSIFDGA